MLAFSTQINELMPDTFVKVQMDNGKIKYGYLIDSIVTQDEISLVSNCYAELALPMKIETFKTRNIVSIDPYMR